jgi:hypothetical protein
MRITLGLQIGAKWLQLQSVLGFAWAQTWELETSAPYTLGRRDFRAMGHEHEWWSVRRTAASPLTAEGAVYESYRGFVPRD